MKLSTRSRYGVRMMVDLADHYGGNPVFLKDIACRQEISEKYLSLIVIPLRGAGLIQSTRGARGGYALSRKPSEITVLDILKALEGDISLVDCVGDEKGCRQSGECATRDVWDALSRSISDTLASVTLAELVERCHKKADNHLMSYI